MESYMKSYLQGQDLQQIIGNNNIINDSLKSEKFKFAIKNTIEEEVLVLEHIRSTEMPKVMMDTFMAISKKNDTRLQFFEKELLYIAQR